jgi:hypothetical protein
VSDTLASKAADIADFQVDDNLANFGKYSGVSGGFTIGTNPLSGQQELMGLQFTIGVGVGLAPMTATLPTINVPSLVRSVVNP